MHQECATHHGIVRCDWANKHPLLASYHDAEWGVPLFDDDRLFEMLSLDIFQAGLSWLTILKKREAFLGAFHGFKIQAVASFPGYKINELMENPGIIRNRLKIPAVIHNAGISLKIAREFGSFSSYIWHFTDGKTIYNHWKYDREIPATSPISDNMSLEMKKRGFRFVGSTICYAFMQSIGMVNDHLVNCFRYPSVSSL